MRQHDTACRARDERSSLEISVAARAGRSLMRVNGTPSHIQNQNNCRASTTLALPVPGQSSGLFPDMDHSAYAASKTRNAENGASSPLAPASRIDTSLLTSVEP